MPDLPAGAVVVTVDAGERAEDGSLAAREHDGEVLLRGLRLGAAGRCAAPVGSGLLLAGEWRHVRGGR